MAISTNQSRTWAMYSIGAAAGGIVAWKYVGGFWATLGGIILGGMAGHGVGRLAFAPTDELEVLRAQNSSTPLTAATIEDARNDYGDRTSDPFAGWGSF